MEYPNFCGVEGFLFPFMPSILVRTLILLLNLYVQSNIHDFWNWPSIYKFFATRSCFVYEKTRK